MRTFLITAITTASMALGTAALADDDTTKSHTTTTTAQGTVSPPAGTVPPSTSMSPSGPTTTPLTTTPPPPITAPPSVSTTTTTSSEFSPEPVIPTVADIPHKETRSFVNRPLLITSAVLLGGTYGASAIVAWTSSRDTDQKNLYIPVAGPWMNLADRQCDARPCNNEGLNKGLLIADGVAQGLGALGVVTSFFIPETTTKNWYLIGNSHVQATPMRVGVAGYGVGAVGSF